VRVRRFTSANLVFPFVSVNWNTISARSSSNTWERRSHLLKPANCSFHISATRAVVAGHLRKLRVDAEAVMEIENPESVKKAVQNGLGIAFISAFAAETDLKAKTLVAVKIRNVEIRRELKIVYRKDKHLSRAAQAFIEIARK
jgi:DNA-binding transcriptional LysR family regulator